MNSSLVMQDRETSRREDGVWVEKASGARFDEDKGEFVGASIERLSGFDTFWYNWSLNNPETKLLGE